MLVLVMDSQTIERGAAGVGQGLGEPLCFSLPPVVE